MSASISMSIDYRSPGILKYPGEEILDTMSMNEVKDIIDELKAESRRLEIESQIFETFLLAYEPSLVVNMAQTLDAATKLHFPTLKAPETVGQICLLSDDPIVGNRSLISEAEIQQRRTQVREEKGPRINFSLKTDLVMREIDGMHESLQKFLNASNRKKGVLKAELEETNIRLQEVRNSKENFEETVVIGGVQKLTQKIPAEKFVWYMQEWLINSHVMLEKLRLRSSSLRIQRNKLKNTLTRKEDLGVFVHAVDFEKLRIENKNFQVSIEQKNKHLLELKLINGRANLMLANHKNLLQKQDHILKSVINKVKTTKKRIVQMSDECILTEKEVEEERENFHRIKTYVESYQVPDVMSYIRAKGELNDLNKALKTWRRKTSIQKVALSTYTKMMMHFTGKKPKASWYVPAKLENQRENSWIEDICFDKIPGA